MKPRTLSGLVLTLAGIGCFVAGSFVLANGIDRQRVQEEQGRRADVACREQLVRLGRFTPGTTSYEVDMGEVKDPRRALADATAALAMCPGREITEACLGVNCGPGGAPGPVRMVVKLGVAGKK